MTPEQIDRLQVGDRLIGNWVHTLPIPVTPLDTIIREITKNGEEIHYLCRLYKPDDRPHLTGTLDRERLLKFVLRTYYPYTTEELLTHPYEWVRELGIQRSKGIHDSR